MIDDFDNISTTGFIVIGLVLLIGIMVNVLYLLTLQNALKSVSPENRKMPPQNVWLLFIPIFSTVYQFIVVGKIADSLDAEFKKRNIECAEARPGYNVGLAFCICFVAGVVPGVGGLASFAGLVCWIIYWVRISNYSKQLGPYNENDNILDQNI